MLAQLFLGLSLVGAEWVLYCLVALSVLSIAILIERIVFYRNALSGISEFRGNLRDLVQKGAWNDALRQAQNRLQSRGENSTCLDLETELAIQLIRQKSTGPNHVGPEILTELASDSVIRRRLHWDKNLTFLATVGNIAPFIGLFGTVLGIIQAFHDLSKQGGGAAHSVTAGISEALIATAVGLLVAIPASLAYNFFQRKVKIAVSEAESLKSFLIGKIHSSAKAE